MTFQFVYIQFLHWCGSNLIYRLSQTNIKDIKWNQFVTISGSISSTTENILTYVKANISAFYLYNRIQNLLLLMFIQSEMECTLFTGLCQTPVSHTPCISTHNQCDHPHWPMIAPCWVYSGEGLAWQTFHTTHQFQLFSTHIRPSVHLIHVT